MILSVRRLEYRDLPIRMHWFNDPFYNQSMPIEVPVSLASTEKWFANIIADSSRLDLIIEDPHSSAPQNIIGFGGLVNLSHKQKTGEIYIMINKVKVNMGFGSIFLKWLCNYGFSCLDLHKISVMTIAGNHDARRLYEKIGFCEEGRLRSHILHYGERVDRFIHGLLQQEWEAEAWACKNIQFDIEL